MKTIRRQQADSQRTAFTLIELVVVVLVLGIIASVAAPKMFNTTQAAKENNARQNLGILRDAIDNYRLQNNQWPGDLGTAADLKSDLEPHVKRFPRNTLRSGAAETGVAVQTSGVPLTTTVGGPFGWRYDNVSGQVILNTNGSSQDGDPFTTW